MNSLIILQSYTMASKAQNYLNRMRIRSRIERIKRPTGCAFGIRVNENANNICQILSKVNIQCIEII